MIKHLIIICFIPGFIIAQTIQLGFRSESTWINATQNKNEFIYLYNPYLTFGIKAQDIPILKDIVLEGRVGYMPIPEYFSGVDISIFLKTHLLTNFTYLTGGYYSHYNSGSDHNLSSTYVKNFDFVGVGIGFNIDKHLFLELLRYFLISNALLGENDSISNGEIIRNQYSLNYLFKFNFGMTFDL